MIRRNSLTEDRQVFVKFLGAMFATGAPGIATRSKDATRGSWPY